MLGIVRALCRGVLRTWIERAPATGRAVALRLPFSRLHRWLPHLFGGLRVIEWHGALLNVNPGETAGYYLYFFPFDPEPELDWLSRECSRAATFLDVGANIGSVALALAVNHPQLRVWAAEPDPSLARMLQRNISLNPAANGRVEVLELAIGATSGQAWFRPASSTNLAVGRLAPAGTRGTDEGYSVAVVTLRDLFLTIGVVPDVMKIDIEGHELAALEGLHGAAALPHSLAIELHSFAFRGAEREQFSRVIPQKLEALGYEARYLIDESRWATSPPDPWPDRLHVFATLRTAGV